MKTYFLLLVMVGFLLMGCGEDEVQWNDQNFREAVGQCVAQLIAPPPRAIETQANSYCTCYLDNVRSRWSYSAYSADVHGTDLALEKEGTLDKCLEQAGL